MTATKRHSSPSAVLRFVGAVLLITALSACSTPSANSSSSPSTSLSASPSGSASSTATPSTAPETPAADAASCETALTAEGFAKLAADGLEVRPSTGSLGPVMEAMVNEGGLSCHWVKPQTDIMLYLSQLDVNESEWPARKTALIDAGFTESDDPMPGTLLAPADYDGNMRPVVAYNNGTMYFVSSANLLNQVAGLQ